MFCESLNSVLETIGLWQTMGLFVFHERAVSDANIAHARAHAHTPFKNRARSKPQADLFISLLIRRCSDF